MYVCMCIYIYASGLVSGPDFRFYELISGPGRVNKRAGSSETTCFKAQNGERFFRAKLRMVRNSRNRTFQKSAIFEAFCALFWPPFLEALFLPWCSSGLSQKCRRGGHARNATKQGVSDRFRVFFPRRLLHLLEKASILRTVFDDNFFCVSLFSTFRSSNFWRNWVLRFKNALGLQSRVVLRSVFFCVVSGTRANLTRGGRAGTSIFLSVWCRWQKWPCRCGAEGFRVFFGFFLVTPFSQTSSGPLHTPSFCLGVFLICSHSSWDWGQRRIARVFLGSWPSTFLFFLVFLQKHCFSPRKRDIVVNFSVSPFRSLTSLCHSFSLFLFLPLCFVFIFTFLVFLLFFVVLFLRFCFMKRTTSTYYIWIFHKLFQFLFCFSDSSFKYVFIFVFSLFKLCVLVNINVFQVFQENHF